jgi:hypothetical protein
MSQTPYPAHDGSYYSFDNSATFSGPFTGAQSPPAGSYRTQNNMPSSEYRALTFGLQQKALVNGKETAASPVNAVTVLATQTATFTPLTTVYASLQASIVSSTMITDVTGDAAKVVFGDGVFEASLRYDAKSGRFVTASTAQSSGLLVSHYDRNEALFAPDAAIKR